MQQTDRIVLVVIRAEGIGAHEFSEARGAMGRGILVRAHFVEDDGNAAVGDLPNRLAACETAANDVNSLHDLWILEIRIKSTMASLENGVASRGFQDGAISCGKIDTMPAKDV